MNQQSSGVEEAMRYSHTGTSPLGGMSFAGQRGKVVWKGGVLGIGQQVTCDTCLEGFALVVPFTLGDPLHVWDLPMTKFGGPGKGIRLRPDPAFKRRVLTEGWVWLAGTLACIALFLAGLKLFVDLQFVPAA